MGYKTPFCLDGHIILGVCCVSCEYHILRGKVGNLLRTRLSRFEAYLCNLKVLCLKCTTLTLHM